MKSEGKWGESWVILGGTSLPKPVPRITARSSGLTKPASASSPQQEEREAPEHCPCPALSFPSLQMSWAALELPCLWWVHGAGGGWWGLHHLFPSSSLWFPGGTSPKQQWGKRSMRDTKGKPGEGGHCSIPRGFGVPVSRPRGGTKGCPAIDRFAAAEFMPFVTRLGLLSAGRAWVMLRRVWRALPGDMAMLTPSSPCCLLRPRSSGPPNSLLLGQESFWDLRAHQPHPEQHLPVRERFV